MSSVIDAEVEAVAMSVAASWEGRLGADVKDVSRPDLARRAGLPDWPGFDLLSRPSERNERQGHRGQGPCRFGQRHIER